MDEVWRKIFPRFSEAHERAIRAMRELEAAPGRFLGSHLVVSTLRRWGLIRWEAQPLSVWEEARLARARERWPGGLLYVATDLLIFLLSAQEEKPAMEMAIMRISEILSIPIPLATNWIREIRRSEEAESRQRFSQFLQAAAHWAGRPHRDPGDGPWEIADLVDPHPNGPTDPQGQAHACCIQPEPAPTRKLSPPEIVHMIQEGLAPELAGLNEAEPERAIRLAFELLKEWSQILQDAMGGSP